MSNEQLDVIHDTLWKVSKGTKELKQILIQEMEATKEVLSNGSLFLHNQDKLINEYAQLVGRIKALKIVLSLIDNERGSE